MSLKKFIIPSKKNDWNIFEHGAKYKEWNNRSSGIFLNYATAGARRISYGTIECCEFFAASINPDNDGSWCYADAYAFFHLHRLAFSRVTRESRVTAAAASRDNWKTSNDWNSRKQGWLLCTAESKQGYIKCTAWIKNARVRDKYIILTDGYRGENAA